MSAANASMTCPGCQQAGLRPDARTCPRCGYILSVEREGGDPLIGTPVGNLVLVSRLGAGGMGVVYRAEHRSLKTPYAVKVLHPQFSSNPATAERFRREALACSQLRHENVVFVTDFGIQESLGIYIVMEFVEGDPLKQVFRQSGRLTIGRLGRIGEQICDAMSAAHRMGIIHRDLKPDNILVLRDPTRRDFIKVLDFGIAHVKVAGEKDEQLTTAGVTMGTPTYIAPEQVVGKAGAIGPGADIYSLGIIFFELLTGAPPFPQGGTDFQTLSHHVQTPAPLISTRFPALSGTALEGLITGMLEKRPDRRPASMQEVKERLLDSIRQLRERRERDAFYEAPAVPEAAAAAPSATPERRTSPSLHVTALIHKIKQDAPDSAAATLLAALPSADSLRGDAIALALWGVLQQELLDAPIESDRFGQALRHLGLLMDTVVYAHGGSTANETQDKIFRSLRNLVTLAQKDRDRLGRIADMLQAVSQHPIFPQDILQKGGGKGGWQALKSVMNKEIKLPWSSGGGGSQARESREAREPARPQAAPVKAASPAPRPDAAARRETMLADVRDKLAQVQDAGRLDAGPPGGLTIADDPWSPRAAGGGEGPEGKLELTLFSDEAPAMAPPPQAQPAGPSAPPAVATPPPAPQAAISEAVSAPQPMAKAPAPQPAARAPASQPAVKTPVSPEERARQLEDAYAAHADRAGALAQEEKYAEAIEEFGAAYWIKPDPTLLFHMAWSHRMLGQHQEAVTYFERYQDAVPNLKPEARARLETYIAEERALLRPVAAPAPIAPEPSAPAPAAAAEPGTYAFHNERAVGLVKSREYGEAIKEFEAAYKLRPNAAILFNIANAYRSLRRPRAALEYFERFEQAQPDISEGVRIKLMGLKAEVRRQIDDAEKQDE